MILIIAHIINNQLKPAIFSFSISPQKKWGVGKEKCGNILTEITCMKHRIHFLIHLFYIFPFIKDRSILSYCIDNNKARASKKVITLAFIIPYQPL